ncbi:MAG: hypothetical protein JWN83_892 [Chitinophagaceae bacterium]|nr:hypothetical protein [Chitinophagaceae bacterium]
MKTLNIYAALLFSIFAINFSFAQKTTILNKKENIKVWGNCETCKKRIENAAKSGGAVTADWNDESQILAVSYDGAKTSSEKIQKAIASSGHDTQAFKADNKAYNKLPSCCKYERNTAFTSMSGKIKSMANCKDMKCCKDNGCCDKNGKCNDKACKEVAECKDMQCCKS